MKKTIIEEYDSSGKLIKKTTIEEDTANPNGLYNPYSPYNPLVKQPTITNIPTTGVVDCLDRNIVCSANDTTSDVIRLDKNRLTDVAITCNASGRPKVNLKGE